MLFVIFLLELYFTSRLTEKRCHLVVVSCNCCFLPTSTTFILIGCRHYESLEGPYMIKHTFISVS